MRQRALKKQASDILKTYELAARLTNEATTQEGREYAAYCRDLLAWLVATITGRAVPRPTWDPR